MAVEDEGEVLEAVEGGPQALDAAAAEQHVAVQPDSARRRRAPTPARDAAVPRGGARRGRARRRPLRTSRHGSKRFRPRELPGRASRDLYAEDERRQRTGSRPAAEMSAVFRWRRFRIEQESGGSEDTRGEVR